MKSEIIRPRLGRAWRRRLMSALVAVEIVFVATMAWNGGWAGVFLAVLTIVAMVTAVANGRVVSIWRDRIRRWGLWRRPSWVDLGWAMTAVGVIYVIGEVYDEFATDGYAAAGDDTLKDWGQIVGGQQGLVLQVGMILLIVVIGPFLEELGWRGYLVGGGRVLLVSFGVSRRLALIAPLAASSLLFGMSHTQYNGYGQLSVVTTGIVYGVVLLKTRNLLLATLAHGANNSLWVFSILA